MRLDSSRAFMREIRAEISRSDCKVRSDETLDRLLRRRVVCCDLVKVTIDDEGEWDELDSESEEVPRTFFAHLEIASSSFAAMAPKRLAARNDEAEDEGDVDMMDGAV
jgi:hypothetical protein